MLVETTNYNRTYSSQYTYENKQTNFGEKLNDQLKANEAGKVDNYNSSNNPVMDLYKDICKAFPNVTFRLDDMSEAMKQQSSNGTYLGYNNSMNQVGNNFGSLNQPSISIDVSVINKALQDPSYKERLMGTIASRVANYDNCRAAAKEQGKSYACLNIEDTGNGIQVSTQCSSVPFATEDEVRRMWSDEWTYSSLANKMRTMAEEFEEKVVESLTEDEDSLKEIDEKVNNKEPLKLIAMDGKGIRCINDESHEVEWEIVFNSQYEYEKAFKMMEWIGSNLNDGMTVTDKDMWFDFLHGRITDSSFINSMKDKL